MPLPTLWTWMSKMNSVSWPALTSKRVLRKMRLLGALTLTVVPLDLRAPLAEEISISR